MITYQVDQCTRWKAFVESCRKQGLVGVRHFPRKLEDKEDPVVLQHVLPSGRTFLTTDRAIHYDNLEHIPDSHPGILIVASASPTRTMTMRIAMDVLAAVKSRFPQWHEQSLRNSVVEITESGAQVWRVHHQRLNSPDYIAFDRPNWQTRLSRLLEQNAGIDVISDEK